MKLASITHAERLELSRSLSTVIEAIDRATVKIKRNRANVRPSVRAMTLAEYHNRRVRLVAMRAEVLATEPLPLFASEAAS